MRQTLQRYISVHGRDEQVTLCGPLPQESVREKLTRADLFVLACVVASSGDRDGIPVSLMEAMAMGVPVVSTETTGIPELITSPNEGLLVHADDPVALADAIEECLRDSRWRQRMAQSAREKITAEFTLSSKSLALYDRITTERH